jgi:Uma2 family endonuclease
MGPKKPVPYQAIVDLPEWKVGEIIDGELVVSPRPASRHALGSTALTAELVGPFQLGRGGPGGWWIVDEPELHWTNGEIFVPDLAGWRRERMPDFPDVPFFTLAPDWICEVLSPSTERVDRSKKLRGYAREGVHHVWLLNPITRTLEVLRRSRRKWLLLGTHASDARVRAEPFEAIELDLLNLWGETRPTESR